MDVVLGSGVVASVGTDADVGSTRPGGGLIDEVIAEQVEAGWMRMMVNLVTGEVLLRAPDLSAA
ncbi:hypothetical protein [Streptomyces sp. RTd22]|uniref:hypothetical protein n=1 Tax=Streptomyces sp. RTd22 TaxID=1841249 RepID=UPI0007C5289C|nr:hypothetical protein [Streptomyces sp. RTd22]